MGSKDILKTAKDFVRRHKTYPSMTQLVLMGMARTTIRDHFGNLQGLHDALYAECKDILFDLNREKIAKLDTKKNKRYVITTAVTGDAVHKESLVSLETYCKLFKAKLIVHVAKGNKSLGQTLDPLLREHFICTEDLNLNTNIKLISVFQSGNKTDPTSGGISRIGKRDSSIVLASPKQRLLYTATGIDSLPHATMGTGAITLPKYDKMKMQGYVSDHDHVMGAIVVEVQDDKIFHFRQVQFAKDGSFVDLGTYISGRKIKDMAPTAMVLGDWHANKTSDMVKKASYDITKFLSIKEWILHDAYDSHSANHHEKGKLLLLSRKAETKELDLELELKGLTRDLTEMSKVLDRVTIVKSNHDEFLDRYLDSGAWIKHPYNTKLCVELAGAMLEGKSPVEYAVNKFGGKNKKVNWLKRDQSHKISGIECGSHGDKGPNGSRGSLGAIEKSYDKVVVGHSHTPGIIREAWCVGTSTLPYPDYGTGPSSWMNTHCLIYPNGQRQLINFLEDGKYTTRKR